MTTASYLMMNHKVEDRKDDAKRMEYEAVMQLWDQAHLMYEMQQKQGYLSEPHDLKQYLDKLSREVSTFTD